MTDRVPQPAGADAWSESVGWEASARLRRARALAMSDDERLLVVEEMIRMAVASGTFRAKRPHVTE
ncbi:MAG TPA: hypothetical protein VIC55_03280 [Gemmatimonadaceae bacterium]|jgi:hypothetical protein